MLELRNVSRVYGDGAGAVAALRDVSLTVEPGQLVAVTGPSGSGKSTLLAIAGTLEEPSSGAVVVGGRLVTGASAAERARLRRRAIGYVFQDFNLLPGLTATENVALALQLDGVLGGRARAVADRALAGLGLADRAGHFPEQLSGGERQRVAIARALVGRRRLLLADEPSGALDSANGEMVMQVIRAACRQGVAAVVVTHDPRLASRADRVVRVRDGHLAGDAGPPAGPRPLTEDAR
jgi:putative ABC transport system ATP-binding protein